MKVICGRGKQFAAGLLILAMVLLMAGCSCGRNNDETSTAESSSNSGLKETGGNGGIGNENNANGGSTNGNNTNGTSTDDTGMQQTEEIGTSSTDGVNQMTQPEYGSTEDNMGDGSGVAQSYVPGIYTGSAKGYGGTIEVTVEVDESRILSVKAEGKDETESVGQAALKKLETQIVESNGTAVEAISGATYSSQGFFEAMEDALAQAYVFAEE